MASEMTWELFTHILGMKFMHYALLAALLSAIACGVVGTLTSVNRLVFLSGGVAHAAYGGIGLAFFFSLPVLPTTPLLLLATFLAMKVGRLVGGLESLDTAVLMPLYADIVAQVFFLVNLAVSWYFGARGTSISKRTK